jgi:replicative DNA helicase
MAKQRGNVANPDRLGGYLPPQDIDTERIVLGAIIKEQGIINRVADILKVDSFYVSAHQVIYEAILALFKKSVPIDYVTVASQLSDMGRIEEVGGGYYLSTLTNSIVNTANISQWVLRVEEKAIARRSINIFNEAIQSMYEDHDTDIFDRLSDIDEKLFQARKAKGANKNVDPKFVAEELKAHILRGIAFKGQSGLNTGIKDLTRITGGWQKQSLITIGARTRHGKSALAAVCMYAAVKDGEPSVFFSMEMRQIELFARIACMKLVEDGHTHLNYSRFFRGLDLTEEDVALVFQAIDDVAQLPIYIDDTPSLSAMQIKTKLMKYISDYGVTSAYVDYIQLAEIAEKKFGNRAEGISQTMTDLKNMAKIFDIPIIVLSQGDRNTEKGFAKAMSLADLKGSGGIEEKSDVVILLYRPEVNSDDPVNENGDSDIGFMYIDVAKNKMGGTGVLRIPFDVKTNYIDPDFEMEWAA